MLSEFADVNNTAQWTVDYVYLGSRLLAAVTPEGGSPALAVQLIAPANGQTVSGNGTTVSLRAQVTSAVGMTVSRVEYYQGGVFVGLSSNAASQYEVSWQNLPNPPGSFTFVARVIATLHTTDDRAASSSPVTITVTYAPDPSPPPEMTDCEVSAFTNAPAAEGGVR